MRPSELWGITWPLAAFYFDRAVRNWANFVDRRTEEAESMIRAQMKNRRGTDGFALQARQVTFNKLVGLSVESAYAAPPKLNNGEQLTKRDVGSISVPKVLNAEGKQVNLSGFNG